VPGTEVVLPCGARARGSAIWHRREDDPERGFGIYCDPYWQPSWPAEVVDWENMGLPRDPDTAVVQIQAAYARAVAGDLVEVGCQAGLGRTGTVLACFAVLGGLAPDEAVAWVRANYAPTAVETPAQERWVGWFARAVGGPRDPAAGRA
jgi:hypothetical protein